MVTLYIPLNDKFKVTETLICKILSENWNKKIAASQQLTQQTTVRGRTLERTPSGKSKPAMTSVPVNVIPPTPAPVATHPSSSSIPMFPEANINQ